MTDAHCPTEDELLDFVEGRLSESARSRTERHFGECDICAALVAEIAHNVSGRPARSEHADAQENGAAPLARGDVVGRYVVRDLLGAGGMGAVYRAYDPQLDREVALKLLKPSAGGAELEARLLREAKAMAKLWTPEVVAVLDAGKHGAQLFIAMELVKGRTLRRWQRDPERTWRDVLATYLRAGRGLAQAHAVGIVHRDFKPDNVLVGDDGRARVTDFGLARGVETVDPLADTLSADVGDAPVLETSLTKTGMVLGTPAYMAPEQLGGMPADVRSDIFSFCVALYEALYGEQPFRGDTIKQLQRAKMRGAIASPKGKRQVPARIRRVLLVGLRPLPSDRYASMNELLAALEASARGRRTPLVAGAIAVAMIAVGVPALRSARSNGARATTGSASAAPGPAPQCTTNRACVDAHGGEPWICRADGSCASLASEDCKPLFDADDLRADDTVWLGVMMPTKDAAPGSFGPLTVGVSDFARRELRDATRALAAPSVGAHVRPVALVACDDSVDATRAARHLVDDARVPAVFGFGTAQEVIDLAGSIFVPRGILAIATRTFNPLVTRVPQLGGPRLVWRTTFSGNELAAAAARILPAALEPRAGRTGKTRVMFAHGDHPSSTALAEPFFRNLVFNEKPAVENGAAYSELTFSAQPTATNRFDEAAAKIVAFAPTFIVLAASTDDTLPLVERVEARWPRAAPRPTYVVLSDSTERFAPLLGKSAERRHRFFTVQSISNTMPNARFVIRYNQAHPEAPIGRTINPGATYDAFYVLAYATYAIGAQPITGPALARGLERLLPPADPVEVGPSGAFDAVTALARGGRIDLVGTQGALDFDVATGESPSDYALLCSGIDNDGHATGEDIESGVVYRAATRSVEGALLCP